MDALKKVENTIAKLEAKVTELRSANRKWMAKYQNAERKIHQLESESINESELEYLRVENSKLKIEINNLKKNSNELEKLKKIERIIKG